MIEKQKNEPLLRLMNQVLNCETWQHGNTARFAKEFSKHTGKKISRANVHSWLIKSGIPPKFIFLAESISQKHGKKISAKELRPDIFNNKA
jgi:hypothetical protein